MGQNNLPGQASDQLPGGAPDPLIPRIIKQGTVSLTFSISESTGVSGSASVDLNNVSANVQSNIDVYMDVSGGGFNFYRKCPFVTFNTNGLMARTVYFDITQGSDPTGNIFSLLISAWDRTLVLNSVRTFYYTVYSNQVGPSSTGGTFPPT